MEETKAKIVDSNGYKNIYPKGQDSKMVDPMPFNSFIKIHKKYPNGIERDGKWGKFYSIKVDYTGEEVGLILNPKEHESYMSVGEVGDEIKIVVTGEQYQHTKDGKTETKTKRVITFDK